MKDRLRQAKWWNRPLANPTQNVYRRFLRMPEGQLPNTLAKSQEKMSSGWKDTLKSKWTEEV